MDNFDYFYEEFFDDNETMEVCCICLRLRLASCLWVRPDEHLLSYFISMKPEHILTECPSCLEETFSGKILL